MAWRCMPITSCCCDVDRTSKYESYTSSGMITTTSLLGLDFTLRFTQPLPEVAPGPDTRTSFSSSSINTGLMITYWLLNWFTVLVYTSISAFQVPGVSDCRLASSCCADLIKRCFTLVLVPTFRNTTSAESI